MSYTLRRRAAALAAAALLTGLTLAGSPVWADPAQPEAAPNVDFSGGGLGLLLCGSKPSTAKIKVAADSKVRLKNSLGQKATLKIDGANSASVGDGETVEVQFHRGPVAVAMVPECLLNLNPTFEPLTVEVSQQTSQPPTTPNASPTGGPASGGSAPVRTPGTGATTPANPAQSPQPGANGGTTGGEEIEGPSPVDSEGEPLFPDELPELGDEDPAVGTVDPQATVVNMDGTSEKSLVSNVPADKGPIGLLAIIATVCVVGVSAGAIRAIIAQRATRAEFA